MTRLTTAEELEAVAGVASALGVGAVTPVVVSLAKHTIIQLAPLPFVARVCSAVGPGQARDGLANEVRVAGYLAARRAPVIRPAQSIDPGPHIRDGCALTLWEFVPHRAATSDEDARLAARALQEFHKAFAPFEGALPAFTDSLDACGDLIATRDRLSSLGAKDHQFLNTLYARLRDALNGFTYPSLPIHGDAHLGNALLSETGAIWGDFEAVCLGPREWDIACLPMHTWSVFDRFDLDLTRCLADLRSLCVAAWCWEDHDRSLQVNEAAEYHLRLLQKRFDSQK